MKLIKTASGKTRIKMSREEWADMGKKAGWIGNSENNRSGWIKKADWQEQYSPAGGVGQFGPTQQTQQPQQVESPQPQQPQQVEMPERQPRPENWAEKYYNIETAQNPQSDPKVLDFIINYGQLHNVAGKGDVLYKAVENPNTSPQTLSNLISELDPHKEDLRKPEIVKRVIENPSTPPEAIEELAEHLASLWDNGFFGGSDWSPPDWNDNDIDFSRNYFAIAYNLSQNPIVKDKRTKEILSWFDELVEYDSNWYGPPQKSVKPDPVPDKPINPFFHQAQHQIFFPKGEFTKDIRDAK